MDYQEVWKRIERSRATWVAGAVLVVLSVLLFWLVISGWTRKEPAPAPTPTPSATSTEPVPLLVPRRLDGVLVPRGEEAYKPRAVMVENYVEARPLSGVALANVVIEAPVEGGITRLFLLYDATTTVAEIGPVRSARPYFVDWAIGWNAAYFHVGGSPDALAKVATAPEGFANIDEMGRSQYFWRARSRPAPHNTYTSSELMEDAGDRYGFSSSSSVIAWHFQDAASTTERGGVVGPKVLYGGNYNVRWEYDAERGVYERLQAGKLMKDKDGTTVEAENVIVIKTDAQVLDSVGRLKLRTTGSGDATVYRDGNKYQIRWTRSAGEPMRFQTSAGTDFLLTRGRTWIQVTTNDLMFAGLGS